MKEVILNEENFEFKKAVKQNIKENVVPLLKAEHFVAYTLNKYIREVDYIAQFVIFRFEVDRMKAFAAYYPIFVPFDNLLSYGIEITGSSGIKLLGGKYFTTIYESEPSDNQIRFQNFQEQHLEKLDKIFLSFKEGIIPEFNEINSFDKFINKFDDAEPKFFGDRFRRHFRNHEVHKYIVSIDHCLNKQFEQGVVELKNLVNDNAEDVISQCAKYLLYAQEGDSVVTREQFVTRLENICDYMRRKYKLIK